MSESKVIFITELQARELAGKEFDKDCRFNPVQDGDGRWVISEQEASQMKIEFTSSLTSLKQQEFNSLKQATQTTFKKPIYKLPWEKKSGEVPPKEPVIKPK